MSRKDAQKSPMKIGRFVPDRGPLRPALIALSLCLALLPASRAAADVV
ncbi:branched chain amino acid ABC transporter substrate-binding protein, partial [Methylobacterium radiotolerans]